MRYVTSALLLTLVAGVAPASASFVASDSSADPTYNGGWSNGQNGGSGFGAWVMSPASNTGNAGFFSFTSSANAGGGSGNIDAGGDSWGMYANSGVTAAAVRPFTGGGLLTGQTFAIAMDNGWIDFAGVVGFELRSGSTVLVTFSFTGGDNQYRLNGVATGVNFTGDGLQLAYTQTSASTFSFTINGGSALSGSTGGLAPDNVRLFNNNAGGGGDRDAYFNSMSIVPTPGAVAVGGLGILAAARRRRA